MNHTNPLTQNSKKDFFKNQTLATFLAGLREPFESTIRVIKKFRDNYAIHLRIRYLKRYQQPVSLQNMVKKPQIALQTIRLV